MWRTSVKPFTMENSSTNTHNTDKSFGQLFKDFTLYSSLHGLHFVLKPISRFRRIMWVILVLFAVGTLVTQIEASVRKLLLRRFAITKSIEDNDTLPFPAITICNQNIMRKSKIEGTAALDFLNQISNVKAASAANETASSIDRETVMKAGHQLKEMIGKCSFPGATCTYKDFEMSSTLSMIVSCTFYLSFLKKK